MDYFSAMKAGFENELQKLSGKLDSLKVYGGLAAGGAGLGGLMGAAAPASHRKDSKGKPMSRKKSALHGAASGAIGAPLGWAVGGQTHHLEDLPKHMKTLAHHAKRVGGYAKTHVQEAARAAKNAPNRKEHAEKAKDIAKDILHKSKTAGFLRAGRRPFKADTLLKKTMTKKSDMVKLSTDSKMLKMPKGSGKYLAVAGLGALGYDQARKAKRDWESGRAMRIQQGY